jgi:peroxiredoxin Q/BCP
MSEIKEGMEAPDFELPSSAGGTLKLSSLRGKSAVVLYFYPKDMTPGCTKEACSFRDLRGELEAAGATILGVSNDDLKSHGKFIEAHGLNFPLLSDEDTTVSAMYGVYVEKEREGRKRMGIERTTFIIDKAGKIAKIFRKVKVDEHADEVLEAVKGLG